MTNPNSNPEIKVAGNQLLEIGKVYEVRHSRKGTFCMKVDSVSGEWIYGVVVGDAPAKAILADNVRYEGDQISIRDVHSYFIPVKEPNDVVQAS